MGTRQGKCKVKAAVMIDEETANLLESWRMQHYMGQHSVSQAIRMILSVYLGAKGWAEGLGDMARRGIQGQAGT